jgi:hypothetical protein
MNQPGAEESLPEQEISYAPSQPESLVMTIQSEQNRFQNLQEYEEKKEIAARPKKKKKKKIVIYDDLDDAEVEKLRDVKNDGYGTNPMSKEMSLN